MKTKPKAQPAEKRIAPRKTVSGLQIKNLTALAPFSIIARNALLVDASSTGILIIINRKSLIPKSLRQNLVLTSIEGEHVMFSIKEMELDMDGRIARTKYIGDGNFEIAVDFEKEAPEYWRECLMDLLPNHNEFDDH